MQKGNHQITCQFYFQIFNETHTVFHTDYINLHQFSTNSVNRFRFLHVLTNICYLWTFDDGHSNSYEVIFHYFDFYLSNNQWVSIFPLTCYWSYHLLNKMKQNKTNSHSICCLLVLLMVSFSVKKLLSLLGLICLFLLFPLPQQVDPNNVAMLSFRVFCLQSLLGFLWFQSLHLVL